MKSGFFYNFYRYYDTDTEQYLSPDPIGLAGVKDAANLQSKGFSQGNFNKAANTSLKEFGLNPTTRKAGNLRPDVFGYNPKTNTIQMVENVSPSQTVSQMAAKMQVVEAAIQSANPNVTVLPSIVH